MSRLEDDSIIWRRNPKERLEKVTIMADDEPPTTEQLLVDLIKKGAEQEALIK